MFPDNFVSILSEAEKEVSELFQSFFLSKHVQHLLNLLLIFIIYNMNEESLGFRMILALFGNFDKGTLGSGKLELYIYIYI